MSQKITPKNLSYSSSLPPFLARLHAEAAGATGPDALAAAARRHGKVRSESQEAEDAPLVVDEHGNEMRLRVDSSGAIIAPRPSEEENEHEAPAVDDCRENPEASRDDEAKSSIGQRKRKVAKIIGADADQPNQRDSAAQNKDSPAKPSGKPKKKKAKKIKLSFDDDQG